MIRVRLTIDELQQLKAMNFTHMVIIAKDVSLRSVGAVESVFCNERDAVHEAERLSQIYGCDGSYAVREI